MNKNTSFINHILQERCILLLLLVLSFSTIQPVHAQQNAIQKPLEIGDVVPDIVLRNVINHADSVIYPWEWEGKLVILSFWATWCTVCIEQMPKMAALQEEFGDQLLIIPVTQDDSVKVHRLLRNVPLLKSVTLPYVTSTVLDHYFPHRTVPHEVWIGPDGRIITITGFDQVTTENIKSVLASSNTRMSVKRDITDHDIRKPFMAGGMGSYRIPVEKIRYSRLLTSYIPGLGSFSSTVNKFDDRVTIKCTNAPLQRLYVHALATSPYSIWPKNDNFYLMFENRHVWEAKDSTLFLSGENREKFRKVADSVKLFNYEIVLPRADSARINEMMFQDLNDYFGHHYNIIGTLENRLVDCWALVCVDSTRLISGGEKKQINISTHSNRIMIVNASVDEFMFWWLAGTSLVYHPVPIINETGITSTIDLDLDVDPSDFEAVKKAISAYGLEFRRVTRPLDMIVFRNKD